MTENRSSSKVAYRDTMLIETKAKNVKKKILVRLYSPGAMQSERVYAGGTLRVLYSIIPPGEAKVYKISIRAGSAVYILEMRNNTHLNPLVVGSQISPCVLSSRKHVDKCFSFFVSPDFAGLE